MTRLPRSLRRVGVQCCNVFRFATGSWNEIWVSDGHPGTKGVLRLKEDCMGKVTHLKSKGERWKEKTLNVEPLLNVGVEHKLN